MQTSTMLRLLAGSLLAVTANAQAFNIDITVAPSPTPSNTFGAYPEIAGVWSSIVPFATPQQLSKLSGGPDNSTVTWNPVPGSGLNGSLPAPFTELYEDFAEGAPGSSYDFNIRDLDAGDYVAIVYSWASDHSTRFEMYDDLGNQTAVEDVSNALVFPNAYIVNETIAQLPFTVNVQDGDVRLRVRADSKPSALNGIQLVRVVGQSGCTQPVNSTGGTPEIVGTGSFANDGVLASANDLVLHVGVLPGSLPNGVGTILCWASNGDGLSIPYACPYTGTRCIGGVNLARVPDPNAAPGSGGAGVTTAYGLYTLPVDLTYLAAAGLNVSAGDTLHFQMIYRDPDFQNQCSGTTVVGRWTNSVSINLY